MVHFDLFFNSWNIFVYTLSMVSRKYLKDGWYLYRASSETLKTLKPGSLCQSLFPLFCQKTQNNLYFKTLNLYFPTLGSVHNWLLVGVVRILKRGTSIIYLTYERGVIYFVLGNGWWDHQFCPFFYQNKNHDYPTDKSLYNEQKHFSLLSIPYQNQKCKQVICSYCQLSNWNQSDLSFYHFMIRLFSFLCYPRGSFKSRHHLN